MYLEHDQTVVGRSNVFTVCSKYKKPKAASRQRQRDREPNLMMNVTPGCNDTPPSQEDINILVDRIIAENKPGVYKFLSFFLSYSFIPVNLDASLIDSLRIISFLFVSIFLLSISPIHIIQHHILEKKLRVQEKNISSGAIASACRKILLIP